jgi:hypothetical protein
MPRGHWLSERLGQQFIIENHPASRRDGHCLSGEGWSDALVTQPRPGRDDSPCDLRSTSNARRALGRSPRSLTTAPSDYIGGTANHPRIDNHLKPGEIPHLGILRRDPRPGKSSNRPADRHKRPLMSLFWIALSGPVQSKFDCLKALDQPR